MRRPTLSLLALTLILAMPKPVSADEARILSRLQEYFRGAGEARRAAIVAEIEKDPEYRRERLSEWLHRLELYRPMKPGRVDLEVAVGLGYGRRVTLRIPQGYTPNRAWPVIYLLHPSGGEGSSFLSFAERTLGPKVEDYVVVAPSSYRQTGLDAPPPFTMDHTSILRAVRRRVHVDGDRQYVMGYSLGGYASWAVAYLHAEEIAGAVPVGSCFSVPPSEDGLWKTVLPNWAYVPVLNIFGAKDTLTVFGNDGRPKGGIADMNRRFIDWTRGMNLPVTHMEIPGKGHGGINPPRDAVLRILTGRRVHYPKTVDHTFRHVHQGRAYWLEAHEWVGESWGEGFPPYRRQGKESDEAAFGRGVRERLANLRGEVKGGQVSVATKHVQSLSIWFGDDLIDWKQPVNVEVDGRKVYTGALKPDLALCLSQVSRTWDLDRLRWAGLRVGPAPQAEVVTAKTEFPPLTEGE
jgi:pimeloyl-ACP methyl ester carboxylesterase